MVINELLLNLLGHSLQWVVRAFQFTIKGFESLLNFGFHLLVLGLSETWVERVSLQRTAATDSGRDDEGSLWVNIHEHRPISQVTSRVLVGLFESRMVVFDDGVEEVGEQRVRLCIRSVDTDSRVRVFAT